MSITNPYASPEIPGQSPLVSRARLAWLLEAIVVLGILVVLLALFLTQVYSSCASYAFATHSRERNVLVCWNVE